MISKGQIKSAKLGARAWRLCVAALLLFVVSTVANAYSFSVRNDDGVTIYYNRSGSEATVTYMNTNYNSYSGNVVIPDSVTYDGKTYTVVSIGSNAFRRSTGLTSITIPNSVTEIGSYAFQGCSGLTHVTIPKSVTTIGMGVFARTGVIRCDVEKGNKQYCAKKGVLFSKDMKKLIAFPPASLMTSYKIPKGVIDIYGGAFMFCTNLTELTIPNSVTSIGRCAFYGCSDLTEVVIGKSVTHIGDKAFVECTTLKKVTSLNPEPPTCDNYVFGRTDDSYCVLYVPEGSKAEYSMAEEWRDFDEVRDMEPSVKEGTITIIVLATCALLLVAVVILLVIIIKLFRKTKQQEATNT